MFVLLLRYRAFLLLSGVSPNNLKSFSILVIIMLMPADSRVPCPFLFFSGFALVSTMRPVSIDVLSLDNLFYTSIVLGLAMTGTLVVFGEVCFKGTGGLAFISAF